jgi:Lrp/AsnC family transcriptional regulator for asnA, asnC and gidA
VRTAEAPLPTLDATDLGIIDILTGNGRATNQEIGERLSITPATVAARIRALEENNAMRVVAVSDFAAHGYNILIAVGVEVYGRRTDEVAAELAKFPEIFSIHQTTGSFDLELLVALRDFAEISLFLNDHVAQVPGIRRLDPGIAARVVKFQFNVAPL